VKKNLSRRDFLGVLAGFTVTSVLGNSVAGFAQALAATGKSKPTQPNIICIMTDDQRFDAMGCAGHPWLKTPHMDRLAHEGVLFKNAFVTTSLCGPSRANFLTGCYSHIHGVTTNYVREEPGDRIKMFPQILQKNGYTTAFIGKWHMRPDDNLRPGFDHWVSFRSQGKYFNCKLNENGTHRISQKYITDELTDCAIDYVNRKHEKPFMLYLSYKAVHAPFTPPKRYKNKFKDREFTLRQHPQDKLENKERWGRKPPVNWKECMRKYAATLTAVDESLGRLLKTLEKRKQLDNTIIVYAGDNGYFHGEHGLWDKRAAYEPSMRIPLIMRYPGKIKPGTVCSDMILNLDLAPTLLDITGITAPAVMQGQSWMGILDGSMKGRDSFLYVYFREPDNFKRPSVLAVRTRRWKYMVYPDLAGTPEELYDLEKDPDEIHNLAGDKTYAKTLEDMRKLLEKQKKETGFKHVFDKKYTESGECLTG
jgi:N-acetylglucosamine-6-sulfatase